MAIFGAASDKDTGKKLGILDRLEDLLESITGSNKGAVSDGEGLLTQGVLQKGVVSDKEKTYGIEVDGKEKDYTFTGDKEFDSSTMDKFRETHGIQADSVDEQFGRVLSAMPVWQQESVINFITSQGMTPAQITKFKQEVLLGNISPYELENLQTNQSTQSNLGLSNDQYAQGSQFYNYDLGVFLPSEWQTGFTGRTVDGNNYFREELQSNPHSKSRNYYEEKMKLPRYIPLKFG